MEALRGGDEHCGTGGTSTKSPHRRLARALGLLVPLALGTYVAGSMLSAGVEGAEDNVQTVILRDVQPLFGGRKLYLSGDGNGVCQIVVRKREATGLYEKRFGVTLSPDARRSLANLIKEHSFFEIFIKERAGLPDEARPAITITLVSGQSLRVTKWANDKNPDFDPIYDALLEQIRLAQAGTPIYEGPYDPRWVPVGFASQ
jgi:hypothetical protein